MFISKIVKFRTHLIYLGLKQKMSKKTPLKGTYNLLIQLKQDSKITIGKLAEESFKKGYYVYVGSALNSLAPRIQRHLRSNKKLHWHIDYLLNHENTEIIDVIYAISDVKWECRIAAAIAETGVEVKNFGCSDCKCHSHLFYFKEYADSKNSCINTLEKFNLKVNTYSKTK